LKKMEIFHEKNLAFTNNDKFKKVS